MPSACASAIGIRYECAWSVSSLVEVAMPDANTDAATLRVLLVDDSPWLRQSVRAALERAGLVVVGEAADGAQALALAATHHP